MGKGGSFIAVVCGNVAGTDNLNFSRGEDGKKLERLSAEEEKEEEVTVVIQIKGTKGLSCILLGAFHKNAFLF